MAKVSIGGVGGQPYFEFDVNPSTFSWGYTLNTSSKETYGGRVVQILSCRISDCTVQGYLPVSSIKRGDNPENMYAEMEKFESRMLQLMDWQAVNKSPLQFNFPLLGWSGDVYITQYGSVSYSYDTAAIMYTLQMTVDDGFEGVRQAITADAQTSIDNIPNGVNWTRNKYNTPSVSWSDALDVVRSILEDSGDYQAVGLQDYYEMLLEKANGGKSESGEGDTVVHTVSTDKTLDEIVAGAAVTAGVISALSLKGAYNAKTG